MPWRVVLPVGVVHAPELAAGPRIKVRGDNGAGEIGHDQVAAFARFERGKAAGVDQALQAVVLRQGDLLDRHRGLRAGKGQQRPHPDAPFPEERHRHGGAGRLPPHLVGLREAQRDAAPAVSRAAEHVHGARPASPGIRTVLHPANLVQQAEGAVAFHRQRKALVSYLHRAGLRGGRRRGQHGEKQR